MERLPRRRTPDSLADRIVGNGDGSLAWPIGKFVAGREVGPVKALAIRALPASMIISLAPGLWVTHYQNAGRVVVRSSGETSLVIKFVDVPHNVRLFCLATGGWIEGFLSPGPRRDIVVRQIACACDGAPRCELNAS